MRTWRSVGFVPATLHHTSLAVFAACVALLVQGCAVLPFYKHPNQPEQPPPNEAVGTYNASLVVPWQYNFAAADEAQAADCRRYLSTRTLAPGRTSDPCTGIPRDRNFVALALSGGGSRSAALSAAVLWELDRIGLLRQVDVISAVSGGAQAAALYALMHDAADVGASETVEDRFILKPDDPSNFVEVFNRNLAADWFASLLMPWHLSAYSTTYLDRTDVMADTFADNYYPRGPWYDINWGMRFRDINPKRPNLIIGAVDMSLRLDANEVPKGIAGRCFTLSYEEFHDALKSDLHDFPISQAVMASSAYPGLFHYISLRDFSRTTPQGDDAYIHLTDGGVRDHLALVPLNAMLRRFAEGKLLMNLRPADITQACEFSRGARTPEEDDPSARSGGPPDAPSEAAAALPDKILVFAVDAGRPPRGFPEDNADPRGYLTERLLPIDKVVDAVDTTLDDQRALRAMELIELRKHLTGKKGREQAVESCIDEAGESVEKLTDCLTRLQDAQPGKKDGVFGRDCCPIIGLGVHDFTKYAAHRFGPLNSDDLDSDKPWGADLITLECLEDNDNGSGRPDSLYSRIRKMQLGLSLASDEVMTIKQAARALVDAMVADFCDAETGGLAGIVEIPCQPPPVRRSIRCGI